jgi:hypothetical protein
MVNSQRLIRWFGHSGPTWAFAFIYALTVTPFTVNFFRRFVSTPESNLFLFNLDFLPLSKVHEFFLPLFILALELISLRLAIGVWREVRGQSEGKLLLALILVFVAFQAFPVFSVYYDARRTEYEKLQSEQPIDPSEEARAEQAFQAAMATYNTNVAAQQEQYNSQQNAISQQIAYEQGFITQANNQIFALTTVGLADQRTSSSSQQQINALKPQIAQAQTELDGLKQEQQQSRPPVAGPPPAKTVDESKRAPLQFTDIQFLTDNAITWNSILSFFISLIFPIVVFGAGFVFARTAEGAELAQFSQLSLVHELEECSTLPKEQQKNFVALLESAIASYIAGLRQAKNLTVANSQLHLQLELENQISRAFGSFHEQVTTSKIDPAARSELLEYIDSYMKKETAAASS